MKTETALTAFCMTTVMLIVGLVLITGFDQKPQIVGQYIGIPTYGQISREPLPLTIVDVDENSPVCYQDAVKACQRNNAGQNFVICTNRAAIDCRLTNSRLVSCILPAGFELKYLSKRECTYGVIDDCKIRCSVGLQNDCVDRSKSRCELIGGAFRNIYESTRKTAYPVSQLKIR